MFVSLHLSPSISLSPPPPPPPLYLSRSFCISGVVYAIERYLWVKTLKLCFPLLSQHTCSSWKWIRDHCLSQEAWPAWPWQTLTHTHTRYLSSCEHTAWPALITLYSHFSMQAGSAHPPACLPSCSPALLLSCYRARSLASFANEPFASR